MLLADVLHLKLHRLFRPHGLCQVAGQFPHPLHTPQDQIEPGMAKHGKPSIAEPQSADSQHVANRGWAQEPTERPLHAVLNKWCHGRAFIEVERGGFFHVDNRKIIDGVVR